MKDAMKGKLSQNGNTSSCLNITAEKIKEHKQIIQYIFQTLLGIASKILV